MLQALVGQNIWCLLSRGKTQPCPSKQPTTPLMPVFTSSPFGLNYNISLLLQMRVCVTSNTAAQGVISTEGGKKSWFWEERQKDGAVGTGALAWWHARPGLRAASPWLAPTQSHALPCQCLFCLGKRLILATRLQCVSCAGAVISWEEAAMCRESC